jgi:glycosyltransferase involved in cell wall biosynthesis
MREASISIVIAVYEMPEALEEALQSIIEQADVAWEVVLCDGGNDVKTLDLIAHYSQHPIRHLRQADAGVYDAMNRGIAASTGQWLYFLGADDRLAHPHALFNLLRVANDTCSLVCGQVHNLAPRAKGVPEYHSPQWSSALLFKNTVHHQGCIYRREHIVHYRYPDHLKVLGDYHLNLWLYQQRFSAICTNNLVAHCEPGGLSKRFNRSLYSEEWQIKRSLLSHVHLIWLPFWLMAKYVYKQL